MPLRQLDGPDAAQLYKAELEEQHTKVLEEVKKLEKKLEKKQSECPSCKGKGIVTEKDLCKGCRGRGMAEQTPGSKIYLECQKCHGKQMKVTERPCPKCRPYDTRKVEEKKDEDQTGKPEAQAPKCGRCSGKGYIPREEKCRSCDGKGTKYIPPKQMISGWSPARNVKCLDCSGRGHKDRKDRCQECHGKGFLKIEPPKEQKKHIQENDL